MKINEDGADRNVSILTKSVTRRPLVGVPLLRKLKHLSAILLQKV